MTITFYVYYLTDFDNLWAYKKNVESANSIGENVWVWKTQVWEPIQ